MSAILERNIKLEREDTPVIPVRQASVSPLIEKATGPQHLSDMDKEGRKRRWLGGLSYKELLGFAQGAIRQGM
jgi:hypothetical protein